MGEHRSSRYGITMNEIRLSIFARYPEPGEVKTRLADAIGADRAATVYCRLLKRTVSVARQSGLQFELRITGGPSSRFGELLGDDLAFAEQGEGGIGDRLARVSTPAILIGSDAPGLTPEILREARDRIASGLAAIGPASDGGYYLLGMPHPMPFLFNDMPWSTAGVLAETRRRLSERNVAMAMLPELIDIDEAADLTGWPELLP